MVAGADWVRLTVGPLLKTKLMPSIAAIARHWETSPQYASKLKKRGCPTHSLKAADAWREANASRRESPNGVLKPARKVKAGRPWKFPEPSKTGDSLLDALNNSVATADMAYKAYKDALLSESPTSAARLSDHSKATQAMLHCNKFYREEQERRSILVPKQVIIEGCRKAMEVVLRMLNKLPSEQGPQCNPENPIMAMKVLQRKVDEIKVATQAAIGGLV